MEMHEVVPVTDLQPHFPRVGLLQLQGLHEIRVNAPGVDREGIIVLKVRGPSCAIAAKGARRESHLQ
eukprot:1571503-Prorocentrum_lima.AAC.1